MTEDMRALQVKSERRELKEEEQRRERALSPTAGRRPSSAIVFGGGGSSQPHSAKSAAGSNSSDSDGDNGGGEGEEDPSGLTRTLSGIGSRLRSPSVLIKAPSINFQNMRSSISVRSHSIMWSPTASTRSVMEDDDGVAALSVSVQTVEQQHQQQQQQEAITDPTKPPDQPS